MEYCIGSSTWVEILCLVFFVHENFPKNLAVISNPSIIGNYNIYHTSYVNATKYATELIRGSHYFKGSKHSLLKITQ